MKSKPMKVKIKMLFAKPQTAVHPADRRVELKTEIDLDKVPADRSQINLANLAGGVCSAAMKENPDLEFFDKLTIEIVAA